MGEVYAAQPTASPFLHAHSPASKDTKDLWDSVFLGDPDFGDIS